MKIGKRTPAYLVLGLLLIAALAASIAVGSVAIPVRTVLQVLASAFTGGTSAADPQGTFAQIILQLRLPRAVLLLLVGAALSGSGAAYQGLFRNPLADPFLIGVSSGAGLGAVAAMLIKFPYTPGGLLAVPAAAFLGGFLTVLIVTQLARVGRTVPTTNLILAGVAVSSFASALTSGLMLSSTGEMRRALVWLLGGGTQAGWGPVLGILPYMVVGLSGLVLLGHPLNVLQFGDEQAQQLGLPVQRVRWITVLLATLATAAAVAYAGVIGFVGLVVPHILRMTCGADYRHLLRLSMLGGAALLLFTDVISRSVMPPQEIPVGIITSLIGAPFFLIILKRAKSQNYW